jgi:large subunit ribosomal protein L21
MYAYADIKGMQFRLVPGEKVKVPLMDQKPGDKIEISTLLSYNDGEKNFFGENCAGFLAKATVLAHGKDPKIIVFRKKRRKGFRVTKGHRQDFTTIQIDELTKA